MNTGEAKLRIKICWLRRKYHGKYVCFIPLTIDGIGATTNLALKNLDKEAMKIIKALKKCKVKCNFSQSMISKAIANNRMKYYL